MSRIFQNVSSPDPRHNNFNLTREILTSGRIGNIIPIQCDLAVPGEFMKQRADFLMRFAPLVGAAMARFNVHFHTFYVPLRLCTPRDAETSGFEEFMMKVTAPSEEIPILPRLIVSADGRIGHDSQAEVNLELTLNDFKIGSLWDYFGLPTYNQTTIGGARADIYKKLWPEKGISLMPFIAYQKIFNDWYRRDQIESEAILPRNCGEVDIYNDGVRDFSLPIDWNDRQKYEGVHELDEDEEAVRQLAIKNLFKLRQRNYERDYFTAALPEPQFGDAVFIGGGTENYQGSFLGSLKMDRVFLNATNRSYTSPASDAYFEEGLKPLRYNSGGDASSSLFQVESYNQMELTLNGDASHLFPMISVNDFRVAMQMQGVTEKMNRGGTRFKEFSNIIYHVDVPDARLQRVEYVGGFKAPVTIGTVVQTSETTENGTPLGTLAGKAQAAGSDTLSKGKRLIWEHGYFITLMSVTPRTSYFGGIPRLFTLHDPIDYYFPDFDRLGEDAVYARELFADLWNDYGTAQGNYEEDEIFGYDPMYSYLKASKSFVTGEFRTTLRDLHASRSFITKPRLSPEFIKVMPEDFDRMFEYMDVDGTSNEHFYTEIIISQIAKKPMSKYSTPLTLM